MGQRTLYGRKYPGSPRPLKGKTERSRWVFTKENIQAAIDECPPAERALHAALVECLGYVDERMYRNGMAIRPESEPCLYD